MRRPCGCYDVSYAQDMAVARTGTQWAFLTGGIAFFALIPLFIGEHLLTMLIYIGIGIIVVLGLNILTGYTGQISVGQSAFMGIGAFAGAHVVMSVFNGAPWAFWIALPCSGIAAALVGVIFGFPSIRIKGLYLALTTLAAQFIIGYSLVHFAGGDFGLHVPPPQLGSFSFDTDMRYYYLVLVVVLLATFFAKNLVRTNIGRAFIAVRDNDISAEALGINVFRHKLLAFLIGCFYAGIGGCLWTFYLMLASAEHYTLWDSIWYLGMLVIGGMGSISGTFFGVFFIRGLDELTRMFAETLGRTFPAMAGGIAGALPILIFSLVVLLFLILEPRGLAHRWELFKTSYRLWPFAHM